MTRILATLAALSLLAACGADGEPAQPTANIGVGVSTSGAYASTSVGVRKGPWNISIGAAF